MKISVKKYAEALADSLSEKEDPKIVSQKIQKFLAVLRRQKKIKILKRFMVIFKNVWQKKSGRLDVRLILPDKINDKEKKALEDSLSDVFKKNVYLEIVADSKVIGGMKMEFGEYVIDGTLKHNLEVFKSQLANSNI